MSENSIVGHITARQEPVIRIRLGVMEDEVLTLVDTGYNGFLQIAEDTRRRAKLLTESNPDERASVRTADDRDVKIYYSDGWFEWFGIKKRVPILVWRREILFRNSEIECVMGMRALTGHTLKFGIDRPTLQIFFTGGSL